MISRHADRPAHDGLQSQQAMGRSRAARQSLKAPHHPLDGADAGLDGQ